MSARGQRRQLHLPEHAAEPHARGEADLEVKVGPLVLHHHPEELVGLGLGWRDGVDVVVFDGAVAMGSR